MINPILFLTCAHKFILKDKVKFNKILWQEPSDSWRFLLPPMFSRTLISSISCNFKSKSRKDHGSRNFKQPKKLLKHYDTQEYSRVENDLKNSHTLPLIPWEETSPTRVTNRGKDQTDQYLHHWLKTKEKPMDSQFALNKWK